MKLPNSYTERGIVHRFPSWKSYSENLRLLPDNPIELQPGQIHPLSQVDSARYGQIAGPRFIAKPPPNLTVKNQAAYIYENFYCSLDKAW